MPLGLTAPGPLFHLAAVIESAEMVPQIFRRIANSLARPGGFVCHLSIPTAVQTHNVTAADAKRLVGVRAGTSAGVSLVKKMRFIANGRPGCPVGGDERSARCRRANPGRTGGTAGRCGHVFPTREGTFFRSGPSAVRRGDGHGRTRHRSVVHEGSSASPNRRARNPSGRANVVLGDPAMISGAGVSSTSILIPMFRGLLIQRLRRHAGLRRRPSAYSSRLCCNIFPQALPRLGAICRARLRCGSNQTACERSGRRR